MADRDGSNDRFVYLVLSHRLPEQVVRLVAAIRALSPTSRVVVLHDATASEPPVIDDAMVTVEMRPRGVWGTFSLVDCVLDRVARLERDDDDWRWVALVSGQDFPVTDLAAWERRLLAAPENALIDETVIGQQLRWGAGRNRPARDLTRYVHRHRRPPRLLAGNGRVRRRYRWTLQRIAEHLAPVVSYFPLPAGGSTVGVRRLRTPFGPGFPCRKGSQWLAFDRLAAQRLVATDAALRAYYRSTLIPDESYIQTVLLNDPALVCRDTPLTATLWDPRWNPHPATLTTANLAPVLEWAESSGAAFARKFDVTIDAEPLETLERRLRVAQ